MSQCSMGKMEMLKFDMLKFDMLKFKLCIAECLRRDLLADPLP